MVSEPSAQRAAGWQTMVSDRFVHALAIRIAALFATLVLLAYVVVATALTVVAVLIGVVVIAETWSLARYVGRTNRELARLLEAIRYDDFQQSFALRELGPTFADLERTFEDVIARFRTARLEREAQRRYLETLVEHVPVAILAVRDEGTVELLNSAARRLLDAPSSLTTTELLAYGAIFQRDVVRAAAGTWSSRIEIDGVKRHVIVSTTQLAVGGVATRLVTVQDIQTELDANELAAWQDMARILSHEILNSLTPIASLARTTDEMVDELARRSPGGDELVGDIHDAIGTLARRSETLMRFVHSYRKVTQMPPPLLRPLELREYLPHLARLFTVELGKRGIDLHVADVAAGVAIVADDALLDQAVINVLRNAADAAAAGRQDRPQIWLEARLSERGRPVIEIADNGPGLDAAHGDQIFLPFFTTKPDGSGIGLALARQVMLVHKGSITAAPRPGGGALFRLTF